jgi:hypothetical protein
MTAAAAAAAAVAAAGLPENCHWQQEQLLLQQQLQWQVTARQALSLASAQQQLQSRAHQLSLGSFGSNAAVDLSSYSSCSTRSAYRHYPLPLSSDLSSRCYSCYNSTATTATLGLPAAAAAPLLLDLAISSLSMTDPYKNQSPLGGVGSSLISSGPSCTCSLLHGSYNSPVNSSSSSSLASGTWTVEPPAPDAAVAAAAAAAAGGCDRSSSSTSSNGSSFDVLAQHLLDDDDNDEGPVVHNHFCRQHVSMALNAVATVLLNTLRSQQYAAENVSKEQEK